MLECCVKMLKKVNLKSDLLKYVVVLMSGTVIAQIIAYSLAPVISRCYTPEESAELGLFIRIVSVGAAIATLRYELALPIPKVDAHSFRLYRIALKSTLIISALAIVILIVPMSLTLNFNSLMFYVLLPISIFFIAMNNLGTNWAIRFKLFHSISYSKITNAIFSGGAKAILGLMGVGYGGLIIGMTFGIVAANFWFIREFFRAKKTYGITSSSPRNYVIASHFNEFPKINLPHVMMDLGRDLLIAVLLLEIFSKEDFGLYDMSYRMLRIPLVMAGAAIGQVFFQRCAEMINRKESVVGTITKSVGVLTLLSIIPFAVVFFFGEEIFAFVFGENWRGAGTYSEIMAPWFMVNFISSPISSLPLVLNKQRAFFKLAAFGSVLMILSIVVPSLLFDQSIIVTLWILSITQAIYLVFVIFKIFDYARKYDVK